MDDPGRDALKTSYVVRFDPWDWAVGMLVVVTLLGIYITLRHIKADRENLAA